MNLAEAHYITTSSGCGQETRRGQSSRNHREPPVQIDPISKVEALAAARFMSDHAICLADAFAAALAESHNTEVVTGDPEFKSIEQKLTV